MLLKMSSSSLSSPNKSGSLLSGGGSLSSAMVSCSRDHNCFDPSGSINPAIRLVYLNITYLIGFYVVTFLVPNQYMPFQYKPLASTCFSMQGLQVLIGKFTQAKLQ